ncbi:MAG: 1-acyl-sn-glycerol-3-phosphate acyltransferase [Clostridia bacterium]|nr:1-acyl-sn-glycerol-3-phosphate acyltransferase [Clostridia bacterium]
MYYRHNLHYDYPEHSDEHMLVVKKVREVNFDVDYHYMPRGLKYKLLRVVYGTLLNTVVFPIMHFTHGLKIYGKKNYKKHKKAFKNGAITISNHVFMWDYLCVLKAIRPHLAYFPVWKTNLEGSFGPFIRLSGGIPVPTDNVHALIKFNKAMEAVLQEGKWLHFFPEGSLWFFYPDIRPLKKAVFKYAVQYDKPVIPITMSFRDRPKIMRIFGKTPFVDLHIGEPLFPDRSLSRFEAEEKLHREAYHVMQVMNGINPGDPTYNTDQNISHYHSTM